MMMNNEENKSLEELMKAATQSVDESLPSPEKDNKSKKIIGVAVVGVLLVGGLIFAGKSLFFDNEDFVDQTKNPGVIADGEGPTELKDLWDFEYTAEVPEWTKAPFSQESFLADEAKMEEMYDWANSIEAIEFATAWLPSKNIIPDGEEKSLYTNQLSEEKLENGMPNMYFSYTLKEDYLRTFAIGINRLLNPVFGNWVFNQHSIEGKPSKDGPSFTQLKDMFSESWWTANVSENTDYSKLPVVADWEGDSFGGLQFADRNSDVLGTFYGIITETEENPVVVEELTSGHRGAPVFKITVPVSFYAKGENDTIKKTGTLTLTLEPNKYEYSEMYRVVISDANLVLN